MKRNSVKKNIAGIFVIVLWLAAAEGLQAWQRRIEALRKYDGLPLVALIAMTVFIITAYYGRDNDKSE